jgi:Arc/MetJ-type ribon-helix-helix transcriptional regulator
MSAELSSDNEAFIIQAIAAGAYQDRNEIIDAGVSMLRKHEQLLERIDEGRRQLDEGRFVDYDDDGLIKLAQQLKERARLAADQSKTP